MLRRRKAQTGLKFWCGGVGAVTVRNGSHNQAVASPMNRRLPRSNPRSSLPSGPLGALLRYAGAAIGGLAAGAAATHLAHRYGYKVGFDLRTPLPDPEDEVRTPEDYDADEPGRGRLARRPEHIPRKGWTDILWRLGASYFGDRVGFVAGGVTFFVLLGLFPTLGAFVSIYGLFADPNGAAGRLEFLYGVLPDGVALFLAAELQRLAENSTPELTFTLVWTLMLSLWAAAGAVRTLFYGINIAYHEVERRSIIRYNLMCLAFTVGGLLAVLLSTALLVGLPVVLALFGLEDEWRQLTILRWPVVLIVYAGALTLIYRYGPSRSKAKWRWLRPGAAFAALLSLLLTLIFSWYVQTFVRTASYGPLAAMMGFILWTWLTVQIVLIGAKLNAEIEHQTALDTTVGPALPLGERGAVVADTVGARRGNPAALAFTLRHAEAISDRILRRRIRDGHRR